MHWHIPRLTVKWISKVSDILFSKLSQLLNILNNNKITVLGPCGPCNSISVSIAKTIFYTACSRQECCSFILSHQSLQKVGTWNWKRRRRHSSAFMLGKEVVTELHKYLCKWESQHDGTEHWGCCVTHHTSVDLKSNMGWQNDTFVWCKLNKQRCHNDKNPATQWTLHLSPFTISYNNITLLFLPVCSVSKFPLSLLRVHQSLKSMWISEQINNMYVCKFRLKHSTWLGCLWSHPDFITMLSSYKITRINNMRIIKVRLWFQQYLLKKWSQRWTIIFSAFCRLLQSPG